MSHSHEKDLQAIKKALVGVTDQLSGEYKEVLEKVMRALDEMIKREQAKLTKEQEGPALSSKSKRTLPNT